MKKDLVIVGCILVTVYLSIFITQKERYLKDDLSAYDKFEAN